MGCGITKKKEMLKFETKCDLSKNNFVEESVLKLDTKKSVEKGKLWQSVIAKPMGSRVEDTYKVLNRIGKGAFGSVYKVIHKQTNFFRAMKIIKKESLMMQDDDKKFLKEIEILIETDHPNIIKIFEYFQDDVNYYLITEYVSGGELYDTIASWDNFNEEKASYILYQIVSAVNYLHSKNIVHRDLKPENILVEKTNVNDPNAITVKLIDFGTCNFYEKEKKLSLRVGTPYYIAPEVLKKNYNEKVDVWSCGVILYILLVGYPPFNGNSTKEILESVREGKYDTKGPEWNKISKEAKDLLKKMLMYEPEKRISAQEAIKHPWLTKLYEMKISLHTDGNYFGRVLRNIKNFNAREKFQQATLAYIVHFFYSSSEIEDLKKVFQTLDTNGDGRLTFQELKIGFEKVFGKHLSDSEVTNIMETVDQDHNGYIEYQEFLRATLNRKTLISEDYLQLAFQKFDLNNDGKLSTNEIKEVLGNTEGEIIREILKVVDKNDDGEISYSEFSEMMRKLLYNTMGETILFESPRKSIIGDIIKTMSPRKIGEKNRGSVSKNDKSDKSEENEKIEINEKKVVKEKALGTENTKFEKNATINDNLSMFSKSAEKSTDGNSHQYKFSHNNTKDRQQDVSNLMNNTQLKEDQINISCIPNKIEIKK